MSLTGTSRLASLSVESDAGSVDLLADPWGLLSGATGLTGPTSDPDVASAPGLRGARLRTIEPVTSPGGHRVFLPLLCRSSTPAALAAAIDALLDATDHRHPSISLRGLRADGTTRKLSVRRYRVEGDVWEPRKLILPWAAVPLRLYAADPDWTSETETIVWPVAQPTGDEYPWPPTSWGDSSIIGRANLVTAGGDVEAWPVWTWRGPADSLTLTHSDGQSLSIPRSLADGDVVTITTNPRAADRVTHSTEGSWWQYLSADSALFPLQPEAQSITATAVDASGEASVSISWEPRWRSLL